MKRVFGAAGIALAVAALGGTLVAGCGSSHSTVDAATATRSNAAHTRNLTWSGGGDFTDPSASPSALPTTLPSADPSPTD